MTADGQVPSYVDPTKASIARVYDYALGGKDNYPVDRETIERVRAVSPEVELLAVDNRAFLIRALRFLASQTTIDQYLDCGSGLPTAENTHQVVQRMNPDARVVYIDNDPSVIAHGRALLEDNDRTMFAPADIFDPASVLGNESIRSFLDFTKPIVLIQNGTLHHYDDPARSPQDIMSEFVDALPSGSYVVVAHFFDPENEDSELARKMEHVFRNSPMGSGSFRTQAEIEGLFPGCEMVSPGVSVCARWWPDGPELTPLAGAQRCIAGGVGRKP